MHACMHAGASTCTVSRFNVFTTRCLFLVLLLNMCLFLSPHVLYSQASKIGFASPDMSFSRAHRGRYRSHLQTHVLDAAPIGFSLLCFGTNTRGHRASAQAAIVGLAQTCPPDLATRPRCQTASLRLASGPVAQWPTGGTRAAASWRLCAEELVPPGFPRGRSLHAQPLAHVHRPLCRLPHRASLPLRLTALCPRTRVRRWTSGWWAATVDLAERAHFFHVEARW